MNNEQLVEALKEARQKLSEQDEVLKEILSVPLKRGIVLENVGRVLDSARYLVLSGHEVQEVTCSPRTFPAVGDFVRFHPKTGAILEVIPKPMEFGRILRVTRVVDNHHCLVDVGGEPRLLFNRSHKVEIGDQVLTDELPATVLKNLGKHEQRFVVQVEKVRWDDIGGLHEAKKQMIEAVELPVKHASIYAKYGKKPLKGLLMYGPPGCGKTMLGKAAATALAELHGVSASQTGFMYVKGPEVLSKWVGETESTVRSLFDRAREHKKKSGYPAIIFIDEAEALLGSRVSGNDSSRSWMSGTVVPTFLAEMDGLEESAAMVLLSTNHPNALDPAIIREGRIDRKVSVHRPTQEDAVEIFQKHLKNKPLNCKKSRPELAKFAAEKLYHTDLKMFALAFESGKSAHFNLSHVTSGAMISGIVDQATSLAMMRDIEKGDTRDAGLKETDIESAVLSIYQQNKDLEFHDDMRMLAAQVGERVVGVTKHVARA